ncbi:DUF4198 domain-containing protein [Sinorhizobium americanum]|uniref:Putative GH25 family protein n=1 Tax=Sinorhizobium americanum TaxID=194963 RepID=A0A4R2BSN1_9HYPH|nr:DUF4198 domain-containing protein [Sinorhizobium americanum]APG83790.1 additional periplasmic component NikK of nickel ECF transporter [Sinorhizobium americanum CCGM7]TCN30737.1 putative GH25 family protein [Sinorhizobium americanum]
MKKLITLVTTAGLTLATAGPALSHGAWVAERWGEFAVIYGHGAGDDGYDPVKVTKATAIDKDGSEIAVKKEPAANHVLLKPENEPALIALEFDNGYWSEDADGKWLNKPKSEVPGARRATRTIKNSIAVIHAHDRLPAFPSQPLQILPLDNPIGLEPGEKYRIRVLFEGKPLAGKEVMLDYVGLPELVSAKTDAKGETEVTLRNAGLNVLAVSHDVPLEDSRAADETGYTATLTFVAEPHVDE